MLDSRFQKLDISRPFHISERIGLQQLSPFFELNSIRRPNIGVKSHWHFSNITVSSDFQTAIDQVSYVLNLSPSWISPLGKIAIDYHHAENHQLIEKYRGGKAIGSFNISGSSLSVDWHIPLLAINKGLWEPHSYLRKVYLVPYFETTTFHLPQASRNSTYLGAEMQLEFFSHYLLEV